MTLQDIIFWGSSAIAIGATLLMLLSRNPFYAVLYLVLSLFGVALIFYTLGAEFLAALEVIVYAGAIMVLFLFVVQMLSPGSGPESTDDLKRPTGKQLLLPGFLAGCLLFITVAALYNTGSLTTAGQSHMFSAREIGVALFRHHYLGVELASLILLIGIVGGMHLGRAATIDDDEVVTDAVR